MMRNQSLTLAKRKDFQEFKIEGLSQKQVGLIYDSLKKPIRDFENEEELKAILVLEIQRLASSYGAREKIEDHVMIECLRIVIDKFKMLGIGELSEAFRMVSSGEITGVNLDMYGGVFNAKILGRVLGAYREFRRKVVARIIQMESQSQIEAKYIEQRAARQRAFDEKFPALLEQAKSEIDHYSKVPAFWYSVCVRLEILKIEVEEARAYYSRAVELAKQELSLQISAGEVKSEIPKLRKSLQLLKLGKDIELSKTIARKLVVFEKVLGKKSKV